MKQRQPDNAPQARASRILHEPVSWIRGGRAAWVLSLTLHAAAFTSVGVCDRYQPQGAVIETTREGGIVLVARSAAKVEYFSESANDDLKSTADIKHVSFSAPSLVEQPAIPGLQLPVAGQAEIGVPGAGELPSAIGTSTNGSTLQSAGRGPSQGIETRVFGVTGKGSRFVYVFDRSSSMEGGPLLAAKHELIASLQSLQSIHQFQIIFYNQEPERMPNFRGGSPRMAYADEQGKRLAASFIGSISAFGATDHIKALQQALQMRPDVIFFLTDADEPQLTSEDFRRIRQWNQGTLINAIEFGVGPPKTRSNFLVKLATDNGGQHTYVDVTRLSR